MYAIGQNHSSNCSKCNRILISIDNTTLRCMECQEEYSKGCGYLLVYDGNNNDVCSNTTCRSVCFTYGIISKCCRGYLVDSDGFQVCTCCGLVVNDTIIHDNMDNTEFEYKSPLIDIYSNNFIPSIIQSISDNIYHTKRKTYPNINKNNLAAYSIYIALITEGVPRPIKEIEIFCGRPNGTICSIVKKVGFPLITNCESSYVSLFINRLTLPYSWNKKINRIITHINLINAKSNIVAALAIFILCEHMSRKHPYFPNPSIQTIANYCNSSIHTIKSHLSQLTKAGIIYI